MSLHHLLPGRYTIRGLIIVAASIAIISVIRYFIVHADQGALKQISVFTTDSLKRFDEQMDVSQEDELRKYSNANALATDAKLHPFDPNHADSATLRKLGFSTRHIHNILAYRAKGGVWHSPDDFKRLYNLSAEDFARLRPYIRIAPSDLCQKAIYVKAYSSPYGAPKAERIEYEKTEKLPEGTKIDLNQADTTLLKKLPGIGSYYARKIVEYREQLGGFIRAEQVNDIEGLPAGIVRFMEVKSNVQPRRICINKATFKQLVRHPYLSYEQTKVIVNFIRQYGPIRSWRDLSFSSAFTSDDFDRLNHYFYF